MCEDRNESRRGLLAAAAGGVVAVGGAAAVWPLLASLGPNRSSLPDVERVDIGAIGEGSWRTVKWRGLPVVVRHRTRREIELARAVPISDLRDPLARVVGQPETLMAADENRTKPGQMRWLVLVALCPRSGCRIEARRIEDALEPGAAWLCPCDACRFDTSGRVISGLSTENLAVPLYRFTSATEIEIGLA